MKRPDKYSYYLNIAKAVSMRSTCLVAHYGSVIVKHDRIISTGYNGSAKGSRNCSDTGCVRDHSGTKRYDLCRAIHSEENAIIVPDLSELRNSILYIARSFALPEHTEEVMPCQNCKRRIINAEIARVICLQNDGIVIVNYPDEWKEEV